MFAWEIEPNYLKYELHGVKAEIIRNDYGFFLAYIYVNSTNSLFGKDEDELIPIFKDIVEITYADYSDNLWKIGIDFGHLSDYIPNDEVREGFDQIFNHFFSQEESIGLGEDLNSFKETHIAKIQNYKNIEYVVNIIEKMINRTFQYTNKSQLN